MNTAIILDNISNESFSRENLLGAIKKVVNPAAGSSQLKYCLASMLEDGTIVRSGRNEYTKAKKDEKKEYSNHYSEEAKQVISCMEEKYLYLDYRVWELNWLNEFVNHMIGSNRIFVEVEKEACEFVYSDLSIAVNQRVLVKPTEKEMLLYCNTNTIVIDKLISESPMGKERYNVPLEKLIVDMLSNKMVSLSKDEYIGALENIQRKYKINKAKILRYARRRGKEEEIKCLLGKTLLQNT